jgi:hypothetical protein
MLTAPTAPNRRQTIPPPTVGDLTLTFEVMELADAGLTLTAYTAERDTHPAMD